MAFYACGQYSRAFVLIGRVEEATPSAGIVASFLRKDRPHLISKLNAVLLAPTPTFDESRLFDDWALTICVARSVAFATEHAISGELELLANADIVLRDAMTISEGASIGILIQALPRLQKRQLQAPKGPQDRAK